MQIGFVFFLKCFKTNVVAIVIVSTFNVIVIEYKVFCLFVIEQVASNRKCLNRITRKHKINVQ